MLGVGLALADGERVEQEDLVHRVGHRVRRLGEHRARPADQTAGQLRDGDQQVGPEGHEDRALALRRHAISLLGLWVPRAVRPVVGMGGVTRGNHARDLLRAGATLVAVGTESFRDPAAASRIWHELKSLQIAETPSTCMNESEPQVEVDVNSPD